MRKYNGTLVVVSTVLTSFCIILFFASLGHSADTPYGSTGTSLPFILGKFTFFAIIPATFWLITFLSSSKVSPDSIAKAKGSLFQDQEMKTIKARFDEMSKKQDELKSKMETLKMSYSQGLINSYTYNHQSDLIKSEFKWIDADKENYKKRYQAIKSLHSELTNLDKLVRDGIISDNQKMEKRNELINKRMRSL